MTDPKAAAERIVAPNVADRSALLNWEDALTVARYVLSLTADKGADERWYLGAQNDGLFIINRPPRPSNDDVDPDSGPTLAIPVAGISRQAAQTIVDAHNAALAAEGARVRERFKHLKGVLALTADKSAEERAREIVAEIENQVDIDHGDAGAWCAEFALAAITAALTAAVAAERERCAGIADTRCAAEQIMRDNRRKADDGDMANAHGDRAQMCKEIASALRGGAK